LANVNSLLPVVGWLAIVFAISFICKNKFPKKKELPRKIVHIGTGPIIPLVWWLEISKELAIGIATAITIALFINHQIRLVPSLEDIPRKSYGTIAYGLSITLLILFFWPQQASAVIAGVLVMAFGDGLAGLIGREVNSLTWKVLGQKKSLVGTLTMGLISCIVLLSITIITGQSFQPIKILSISALAVLLEQISIGGIDNLTVPIGVALCWIWIMNI
tara:strand:- start:241 stop:894 length:654 start_codon:yes stop_codon:yes gene_type:complete